MATKITYADKDCMSENPSIPNICKITDNDMNEIKTCFNELVDEFNELVIDNLTSTSTTNALSAYQGKILYDKLLTLEGKINSIETIVNKLNNNLGDLTVEVIDEW